MIDPSKLRLLRNYVLVLPDKAFETYQFGGKETDILVANYKKDDKGISHSTEMEHVAISGIVYGVCEELDYRGNEIWYIQDNASMRRGSLVRVPEAQKMIDEHRKYSVSYDVEIETKVGDRVYFDYFAHKLSETVETIHGTMMLIKYDMLIMAERDEQVIPLNGWVIIENHKAEKQVVEKGVEGFITESGIVLIDNQSEKKNRVSAEASVVGVGCRCKSYLENRGKEDATGFFHYLGNHKWQWQHGDLEQGTKILYDPRYAKEIEFGLHRVFSDRRLLRIQRKDIYAVLDKKEAEIAYI